MIKEYRVSKSNSTVCGYSGRNFDWSKFCWDGSQINKAILIGDKDYNAPKPFVDDCLIADNCQYLHVPYDFEEDGTIFRVRPNPTMYAGEVYRGRKIKEQKAIEKDGIWYWQLIFED